jgi:hypothetical protein
VRTPDDMTLRSVFADFLEDVDPEWSVLIRIDRELDLLRAVAWREAGFKSPQALGDLIGDTLNRRRTYLNICERRLLDTRFPSINALARRFVPRYVKWVYGFPDQIHIVSEYDQRNLCAVIQCPIRRCLTRHRPVRTANVFGHEFRWYAKEENSSEWESPFPLDARVFELLTGSKRDDGNVETTRSAHEYWPSGSRVRRRDGIRHTLSRYAIYETVDTACIDLSYAVVRAARRTCMLPDIDHPIMDQKRDTS